MTVSRDHYYRLASEVPDERIEAAKTLISELLAEDSVAEFDYALNRLVKGLTSTKQAARYGFSMALTELIRDLVPRKNYNLTIESYMRMLTDASQTTGSMKGSEVRALLFGRLFGFQALVNSGVLLGSTSSSATLETFFTAMVQLSGQKSWLRETAMYSLCQFLTAYMDSSFQSEKTTVAFLQSISDEGLVFTTEGLAFYMCFPRDELPRLLDQVRSASQWKNGDPLTSGNLPTLAKVLKDAEVVESVDEDENQPKKLQKNGKQKGSWSPKVPFVWDYLLEHYAATVQENDDVVETEIAKKRKKSSTQSKKKARANTVESIPFKDFWRVTVDETMFSERSSPERKYWGVDIFNKFLTRMPAQISDLLTPNLLRCLAMNSTNKNKLLNKFSKTTLEKLTSVCHADLALVAPTLRAIIEDCGYWNLDAISKTKTIDSLVTAVAHAKDPDSQAEEVVAGIFDILLSIYKSSLKSQRNMSLKDEVEFQEKNSNDNILRWALEKMVQLFRSTKNLQELPKVTDDFVKFLLTQCYFRTQQDTASQSIQRFAREKLNIFLSDFISRKRKDHSWSLYCVKQIEKLEKKKDLELALELSEDLEAIKNESMDTLDEIKKAMKSDESNGNQQYCFELLFSMVLLQLYAGEAETVSVLEDLKVSYDSTFGGNEEVDSSVIITEIVLSFISRQSSVLKKLSNMVWESFMCQKTDGTLNVNEKCFERLFEILATAENAEGQKDLFEGEEEFAGSDGSGSENEDEDDDDEEKEEDEDEEAIKKDAEAQRLSSNEQVEKDTKIKLANALGINHDGEVKFEDISDFGDDDAYESESMDDEQMMAIDDQLSKIFRERHNALTANNKNKKKNEEVQAREQILFFKNRVLDLMELFLKVQPNSHFGLSFIRPIVNLINSTKNKDLGVKAHKLLKTRINKVKPSHEEIVAEFGSDDEIKTYCNGLLEEMRWLQTQAATKSKNKSHGLACGQGCICISKFLVAVNKEFLPEIVSIYCGTMTQWAMERKNKIQASVFFDFVNWLNDKRSA